MERIMATRSTKLLEEQREKAECRRKIALSGRHDLKKQRHPHFFTFRRTRHDNGSESRSGQTSWRDLPCLVLRVMSRPEQDLWP